MPGEYLSVKEAADLLGVARITIRRWTATGKLPEIRLPNGHRRIPRPAVEAILKGKQ